MTPNRMGAYFEEFTEGEVIQHALSKTVTESDNNLFSPLTMNHHPVHLDVSYARNNQHGRILAVGMPVSYISEPAISSLGFEEVVHPAHLQGIYAPVSDGPLACSRLDAILPMPDAVLDLLLDNHELYTN